jgi:predicted protein tyrosine phosphatase
VRTALRGRVGANDRAWRYSSRAMKIFVYSRSALEAVRPHEVPHVIISITSHPDDVARLRLNEMCSGVLRLSFPDAEVPSDLYGETSLFSREQATEIWTFTRQHVAEIERVIVHCDAGVSRSSAIAAALARVLNDDDSEFFGGGTGPTCASIASFSKPVLPRCRDRMATARARCRSPTPIALRPADDRGDLRRPRRQPARISAQGRSRHRARLLQAELRELLPDRMLVANPELYVGDPDALPLARGSAPRCDRALTPSKRQRTAQPEAQRTLDQHDGD